MFKSIISKWALPVLMAIVSIDALAQADQVISGGNSVSSFICGNGKIYTMGVGIGSSPVNVKIIDENNQILDAKQVSSGSGNTFLALDCNSDVWAWGDNQAGQVGNGEKSSNKVVSPVRVLAGTKVPSKFKKTIGGIDYLTGAFVVYAGNVNSYAILKDGTLASWGANSKQVGCNVDWCNNSGQLGDGTTADASSAVLVIDGATGNPLAGVTMVYAGDNVSYALAGGTMFSWGYGAYGTLGRAANGGVGSATGATVQSSLAYPVMKADGTPMKNLLKIAAGDVFGAALDASGYVWIWGNSWNTVNGGGGSTAIPKKLGKGTTLQVNGDNDGTYLLAKDIDGGQGFGMAVTASGSPVAWGGGGCSGGGGGVTGNGTLNGNGSNGPSYILTAANTWHKDVINICRGDLGGFYVRKDNTIWTWGCNSSSTFSNVAGVLGLGNTTDQPYAVSWTPPSGCGIMDPFPSARISTRDTSVCTSSFAGVTLKSGFVIGTVMAPYYTLKWYKEGNLVKTTTADQSLDYLATTAGKYKVEISYTGTNSGCITYPVAKDSMTISYFSQTFTVPFNLTYCNNNALVNVNSYSTTNPVYAWYSSSSSITPITKTVASGSTFLDVSSIINSNSNIKTIYVEEKNTISGVVFKKNEAKDTTYGYWDNWGSASSQEQGFIVNVPITLDTMKMNVNSLLLKAGQISQSCKIGLFAAITMNGGIVPDKTKLLDSITYTFVRSETLLNYGFKTESVIIPVGFKIKTPGIYFIAFKSVSSLVGSGSIQIGTGSSGQLLPIKDKVTGNSIQYAYSGTLGNPNTGANAKQGYFYDIKFSTDSKSCNRVPVLLTTTDSSVSVINKTTLSANQYVATYQWYSCTGNSKIDGATSKTFTPSISGYYNVSIATNNCTVQSNCNYVDIVTSLENQNYSSQIFPNPASDVVNIQLSDVVNGTISILDVRGNEVLSQVASGKEFTISTSNLASGVYVVKINSDKISINKQIVILR